MIDVHHCPRCELQFPTASEVADHFARDHGADQGVFDRYAYRRKQARPETPVVVALANQTLADEALLAQLASRGHAGHRVEIVVPVLHHGDSGAPAEATDEQLARARLTHALEDLRARGVAAAGALGDLDPYLAIAERVARLARAGTPIAGVVVGTLGDGPSRWLRADLVTRIERNLQLPVTLVSRAPAATG